MKMTKGTPATFPELRGNLAGLRWPCFAEVKYDGEACLIGYHNSAPIPIFTSNKYGTMRHEWGKLDSIQSILEDNDVEQAVFLAELFYGEGKKGDLYKLLSHKDDDTLNLIIYDVGHITFKNSKMAGEVTPLITRKEILSELFPSGAGFTSWSIKPHIVEGRLEAESYFGDVTDDGYEGIVLKPLDGFLTHGPCAWVKMKFKDRSEYKVIAVSNTQERIEIAVPVPPAPGTLQLIAKYIPCGVKVTNKHKASLRPGDTVEIEHQGVLDSGSLRHPVFIRKVEGERNG
jgi:hypothetical protein